MMEEHPAFGVPSLWLFVQYIHSYPPKLEAVSAIRNRMTRHALVQETHLVRKNGILVHVRLFFSVTKENVKCVYFEFIF